MAKREGDQLGAERGETTLSIGSGAAGGMSVWSSHFRACRTPAGAHGSAATPGRSTGAVSEGGVVRLLGVSPVALSCMLCASRCGVHSDELALMV